MLMMGEGNSYNDSPGYLTTGDPSADFDFDALSIDLDEINRILEENSGSLQSKAEDPSFRTQGGSALESNQFQSGYSSETSGARAGSVGGSFDYQRKLEPHSHDCSVVQTSSASFEDWFSIAQLTTYTERVNMSLPEMPSCSTASSFVEIDNNHVLDCGDNLNFDLVDNRNGTEPKDTAADFHKESMLVIP
ncbi:uncharacterized protein LOC120209889 [Hibiscus syriacus]|uniref:uncharacterized protein LOC120209889 n=1 Tax=Hibiscus syriacus TaxID=106335 RepID=UPI001922BD0F|nr:uncharacterized protein LOC120209889 [Hibiscus syriacus]